MTPLRPPLRDAALRWIADDPDPATRTELQRVLAAAMVGDATAAADLADRMSGPPGRGRRRSSAAQRRAAAAARS